MNKNRDFIIIILVIIIIVLSIVIYSQDKKSATLKTSNSSTINTPATINKGITSKTESFPNQNPTTVIQYIIGHYNSCIDSSICPISSNFRTISKKYIKNKGKLNPITRLTGNFLTPTYSIVTELPTISIIKVSNFNGSNSIEYDLSNINNKWVLTNSYCFNNPDSKITATNIISCN
jgi:hypothetical protein